MYWFGIPIQFGNTFQSQSQGLFLLSLKKKTAIVRFMRTLQGMLSNLAYLNLKRTLVGKGDKLLDRTLRLVLRILREVSKRFFILRMMFKII